MSAMLNPATEFDYSPRVRELFANLKHAGSLTTGTTVSSAMVGSREQGASVQLFVDVRDARVLSVRYQAYGCPHFLAACESLAQWMDGRTVSELSQWRWRDVETELAVPAGKRSRLLLLDEVLLALNKSIGRLG
jgi:nitrogen fixation protein NifU and related proteins